MPSRVTTTAIRPGVGSIVTVGSVFIGASIVLLAENETQNAEVARSLGVVCYAFAVRLAHLSSQGIATKTLTL